MIFHQPFNSLSNYNFNAHFYTDQIWNPHFHRNLELIYVVKGSINCTVNNKVHRLNEGSFGLCLPYEIHSIEPQKSSLYWVLVFSEDFVRYFSKEILNKAGADFVFRIDEVTLSYIKDKLINNPSPSIYTLKSCLYAICEEYINSIPLNEKPSKEAEIMPLIADYILENHTRDISLKDIANLLGYDYNYMSRYFKNIFNMTFTDFVNIYRLETAIKLLEETDKTITAIALESGFQSVRNFNSFFKNNTGKSPSEYKKKKFRS